LNPERYDVAIAGGGPAGAVAGMVCASLGLRTIVLEAAAEARWKPGEVLAPECNPILRELGLWSVLASRPDVAMPCAGIRSRWGGDDEYFRDGFREPPGAGWIVDRRAFETMLSERAVSAGVHWIWGARVASAERRDGGWRIAVPSGRIEARLLIDATGRPAKVARGLGARRIRHQSQIATVARWPASEARSGWLYIESVPDGWWYEVTDPSGARIVARFGNRAAKDGLRTATFSAESAALDRCAGEGWLAVGDAATAFDPIASQGLSNALASANAAGHAAYRYLRGEFGVVEDYVAKMAAAYEFYLGGVQLHYRSERRWPDQPFWRLRHVGSVAHT
jgi:flavin-dependent dehydrogenase